MTLLPGSVVGVDGVHLQWVPGGFIEVKENRPLALANDRIKELESLLNVLCDELGEPKYDHLLDSVRSLKRKANK